ncbi:MAG: hypothetical protein LBG09_01910, partial [Puniceicoccales bacterium]|nr:hypothetical protein [Puniceicoccales bacterium]
PASQATVTPPLPNPSTPEKSHVSFPSIPEKSHVSFPFSNDPLALNAIQSVLDHFAPDTPEFPASQATVPSPLPNPSIPEQGHASYPFSNDPLALNAIQSVLDRFAPDTPTPPLPINEEKLPPENQDPTRYTPKGAFYPYDIQNPNHSASCTRVLGRTKNSNFDQKTKNIFFDICDFFSFLKRELFFKICWDDALDRSLDHLTEPNRIACEALKSADGILPYAFPEGIGSKGCYTSIQVIDVIVSVAVYMLTQLTPSPLTPNLLTQNLHLNDRQRIVVLKMLEKYLIKMASIMAVMARNSSAWPYWENIAENLAIAGTILGIDLTLERR